MPYEMLVKEAHSMIDEIPHEKIEYVIGILKNACFAREEVGGNRRSIPGRKFGALKDIPFKMSDDFDAPLEDFAEYM